jgi:hypothetical protein
MKARIPERDRWRSIWISDLHLGSKHVQVDALLEFLKDRRPRGSGLITWMFIVWAGTVVPLAGLLIALTRR